jgi:hypothetical protein
MLIGHRLVTPSNGLIVSPEAIALSPSDELGAARAAGLRGLLEQTQERWMEGWSHA